MENFAMQGSFTIYITKVHYLAYRRGNLTSMVHINPLRSECF